MAPTPRDRRLTKDQESINELTHRSNLIEATVVSRTPTGLPEVWEITYRCRGIVGVNPDESPIYGEHHRVRISLGKDYPRAAPDLMWLTDIWHPNIRHRPPRLVCINTWNPGRTLDDTVLMLGEMIQYKNYHAADSPPYPLDGKVARWVRRAELLGVVGKDRPVDNRELLRPARIKLTSGRAPAGPAASSTLALPGTPVAGGTGRVKFGRSGS
jgi:ubiquitin-protein ligase